MGRIAQVHRDRTYLVWLLVLVVLAGCRQGGPQPPLESYRTLPRVALHDSVVTIPFTIVLDDVHSAVERSPFMATTATSGWTKLDCRGPNPLGISPRLCAVYLSLGQMYGGVDEYRYRIAPDRSSLTLIAGSGKPDEAQLFTDVSLGYYAELRGREVTRSCGDPAHDVNPATGKNDYLHFHLRETMRVRVAPDFGLQVAFTHTLSPDAPCRVQVLFFVNRDITDSIKGLESKTIARGEGDLEARSRSLSRRFQTAVKDAWARIQQPYPVAPQFGEYLHLHPKALALLPIVTSGRGSRLVIKSGLQIVVAPEITNDASTTALVPLPRVTVRSGAINPHRVVVEATLRYTDASELLRKRLIGRRFRYRFLPPVTVTNVTVFPVSDEGRPKLAVRFDYRGLFKGSLYAWGTPLYDGATERISVPDLEFTPGTNGLLSQPVRPMFRQSKFLRTLRNTATFDVREQISKLNAVALGTYVRNVGNGISARGHFHHVRVRAISLTRDGITAEVEFDGDISTEAAFDVATLFR
jgi:hypothetical protein